MLFEGRQDIQTELQYRDSEKSILRFPKDTAKIIRSKKHLGSNPYFIIQRLIRCTMIYFQLHDHF